MCYTTNSTARLPAPHKVWLTKLAHTAAQRSLQVRFASAHLGRGPYSWDAYSMPSRRGHEPWCHSASAKPVNKHCSGWDHTRGQCSTQKQSPDLRRSKLKFYLLSYTSFCCRAEVPKGCFLQSTTEIMKQDRFIPVQESGPYTFIVNKLQNLDIFHALPHTCKFIQIHQACQHLSRWLPFN